MATRTVFDDFRCLIGQHRIQRVSPTEKRGRRHSSTVTVIAFEESELEEISVNKGDIRIDTFRASGAGGQHRNKTDSAVRLTHYPSGIVATSVKSRSQIDNRATAMLELVERLTEQSKKSWAEQIHLLKSTLISFDRTGTQRAATWTDWRDEVVFHDRGIKMSMKQSLKGNFKFR